MYAIIDIETTGGSHKHEKITEIAVYIHDGSKVVEEFATLINPERNIPYFITNLTGITNEMVADAPKFFEVARRIVEITENCIFVAHNVNFDYHFVREEFSRLGYDYIRDILCTVKMSRKLIPGKRSYSLGNLCDDLGILVNDRHRATGDALATVKLFEILLSANGENMKGSSTALLKKNLHPNLDTSIISKLPHETGVYQFLNEKGDIIYIGKSNDIRDRVNSHFNNTTTKKALEMRSHITDIGYDLTGSELVALLKESFDIKKHKPLYNRTQRRTMHHFGIYTYIDGNGYVRFQVGQNSGSADLPIVSFNNSAEAKQYLALLVEKYKLCQKLSGLYNSSEGCFQYQIRECFGACKGEESTDEYNMRAKQVIHLFEFESENFWIIDRGRHSAELTVVRIRNGKYLGFGHIGTDDPISNTENLSDCIKSYPDNREVQQIIKNYLKNHPSVRIIKD